MGNPSLRPPDPAQPADAASGQPPAANGILTQIPAAFIGAGSDQLPPASATAESPREVVLLVPHLGQVRLTYQVNTYKHGRSRHWHWRAVRADAVSAPGAEDSK